MRKSTLFIFILSGLMACSTQELTEKAKIDAYFDLEGTLNTVIEDLVSQKAVLEKKTMINDESEMVRLSLDSAALWKSQLEVFYESDINKVGLLNSYRIDTIEAFDGIQKVLYTATKKESYVKSMESSFRDGKLFLVRILSSDKNMVYEISNEFTLYFNHFKRKLALDHYTINTQKKMMLKSDMDVQVDAEIILP